MEQSLEQTLDQALVTRIVEAALLAAHQPLALVQLHGLFPLDAPAPDGSVERALDTLREGSADRGVELGVPTRAVDGDNRRGVRGGAGRVRAVRRAAGARPGLRLPRADAVRPVRVRPARPQGAPVP